MPSRWDFQYFEKCEKLDGSSHIAMFDIYQSVIIEAFFWGLGTAIGELPPYFVSRAASLAGNKTEEIKELMNE